MKNEERNALHHRINYFYTQKLKAHVKLKSGAFYNGIITEVNSDFFMFKDRKVGSMPIFLIELEKIEGFISDEK